MTATPCGSCTAPVPDGYLCTDCTGKLAAALKTAASIAPDLDDAVARLLRRGGGGRVSSEVPLPFDTEASDAASTLRLELIGWLVEINSATLPSSIRPLAVRLLRDLGYLRQHPRAGTAHREITGAVQRAVRVVDRIPERAPAGTCEQCGAPLLAELGADEVRCSCGALAAGLISKRRERAAAADVLGTPGEISGALYSLGIVVSASTIRVWASRGRLAQRPGGTSERPVYAMSEVMHLCARRSHHG